MNEEGQGQEHEPKISEIEVIFWVLVLLIPDVTSVFMLLVGLDDFTVLDILFGAPLGIYYYSKGLLGAQKVAKRMLPWVIATFAGELLPYVGVLPFYTLGFLVVVYLDRHPKIEAIAEKFEMGRGSKGAGALTEAETGATAGGVAAQAREEVAAAGGVGGGELAGEAAAGGEPVAVGERATAERREGRAPRLARAGEPAETEEAAEGEQPAESEEERRAKLSPEEQEIEDIMSGDPFGRKLLRTMSIEEWDPLESTCRHASLSIL